MSPTFVARSGKLAERDYLPSYERPGPFVDDAHERMPDLVRAVPGWLRDEDVLKLYELAWCSDTPVLEIGSYRGKSAVVQASGLRAAGSPHRLISLDIDRDSIEAARAAVREHGLADRAVFVLGSLRALLEELPAFRSGLVFMDGDHSFRGATRDLRLLAPVVAREGLVLCHDYLDERNADPAAQDIEVVRSVHASWVERECEFAGVFGCCGLFRRTRGGEAAEDQPALDRWLAGQVPGADGLPPLVDLMARDDWRVRYEVGVRRPLARWARRVAGRERPVQD